MADDVFVNVMNEPDWRSQGVFYGKYRGIVRDNKDPDKRGRILAEVPAVSGMKTNWANPCVPYAGKDVGFYAIPPLGAKVWIEFEGGNPSFPIWSGCFWQKEEVPTEVGNNKDDPSQVKVLKTRVMTLWVDDTDKKGQVTLQFVDPTVSEPVTVKMAIDSTGLVISVAGKKETSTVTQVPDRIETKSKTLATTSTEHTTFTAQKNLTAKASEDIKIEATSNVGISASKNLSAKGQNTTVQANQGLTLEGANSTLKGQTSVSVTGSSAEVKATGATSIKGSMVSIN